MSDTLIHESANSKVFQSPSSSWGMPVVTKVLNREYPSDRSIRQFQNELEILEELEVEGVRRALTLGKERGRHALVLEWVPGETVRSLAREHPFELETFLEVASEAARILGEVHRRQVIHRDVSGVNLLLDSATERVFLIDFGIASRVDLKQAHLGNPETLEGNLSYISPEQTGRMNRAVDHRADLYSLGVTCFEALTGRLPFEGDDALELVHSHIAQSPPRVHELRPEVPSLVSDIIDRLLAKNADDRYQSAFGLEHDLRRCLEAVGEGRSLDEAPIPLGERDHSGRFHQPQKLYGRERELRQLLDAFERVAEGEVETLLVGGYSGTGKSALVHEIMGPITERRGYFVEGKFDQYQRALPYDAVLRAFRGLVELILTEKEARLAELRERLREAVGTEGKVLTDVLPGLEHVIGPQPEVADVGGQEAQNRFNYVFRRFVAAVATADHPLVLFIDDLQWADSASLSLLRALATDPDSRYLLCVCAYRDNEVDPSHPFLVTVGQMEEAGAEVGRITVGNLTEGDVLALVSDALQEPREAVRPLVELVYSKTRGNAFFVVQFFGSLYREELLGFSFTDLRWQWDVEKIRAKGITD
ncbi:MAG: AAA family ATPase, partial [Holophagales bacterium]|nr:AAA family ATPase [Holophagales bacterium]